MKRDEFERNISQLLNLLKKILRHHPSEGSQLSQLFDSKKLDQVVLNLCFFNFIPVTSEEMDELEEAYADSLEQDSETGDGTRESDFNWNQNDVEFLRRHGMKL